MIWHRKNITEKLNSIVDGRMQAMRDLWFREKQCQKRYQEFRLQALPWFAGSRLNDIQGWSALPCLDVTMGCTHFIESFVQKHGWNGFQILKDEYAYYTLMGKHGVEIDQLESGKPLIITMPHWGACDIRSEWYDVLKVCEHRNIAIHIDMAWITTAKDISIDLSHPCIHSVGLSLSKLYLQWGRVGIRLSRQKSMDSITIFNDFYQDTNTVLTSLGSFWMDNFDRDYLWMTYGQEHSALCQQLDLQPTKIIHVAQCKNTGKSLGIGKMLGRTTPYGV